MGTAAEALEKHLILAERRFRDIVKGDRLYDGEHIEILMEQLLSAYDALVKHEQQMIQDLEKTTLSD